MPRLKRKLPAYRLHKPSGRAVVTRNGKDIYLGRHGSDESRAEYDRLIAEWLANHRQTPSETSSPTPCDQAAAAGTTLTVNELFLAYWDFATGYYVKHGQPTNELGLIRLAVRPLIDLYGSTEVAAFGPLRRKAVRQRMIDRDLTGRQFFKDAVLGHALLERVREAAGEAGLWEELDTGWLWLNCG